MTDKLWHLGDSPKGPLGFEIFVKETKTERCNCDECPRGGKHESTEEMAIVYGEIGTAADADIPARIVNCVNACLGIANAPPGIVAEMRAALVAIKEHLGTTFPPYPEGKSPYDKVRAVLAKLEAKS